VGGITYPILSNRFSPPSFPVPYIFVFVGRVTSKSLTRFPSGGRPAVAKDEEVDYIFQPSMILPQRRQIIKVKKE
jgi:hypothetical protein